MSPYATAIRIAERAVENKSRMLAVAETKLAKVDTLQANIASDLANECSVVCDDYVVPVHAFHARRRNERDQLAAARALITAEIDTVRTALSKARAQQSGLETAAEAWAQEQRRRRDLAEQAAADDRSASCAAKLASRRRDIVRRAAATTGMS